MRYFLSSLLVMLCLIPGLTPTAWAQNTAKEEPPPDPSKWYWGLTLRQDGILGSVEGENSAALGEFQAGAQIFHRMDDYFGTGASILFLPSDSNFAINLDARWIWPLPLVEPYIGIQGEYLTRKEGGLALAPRLGLQIETEQIPVQIDLYFLGRYDISAVVFNGLRSATPFSLGLGISFLYRI